MAKRIAQHSGDQGLSKRLGFWQLYLIAAGGTIGSGWLFAVLLSDSLAGPAVIVSWLIGGVLVAAVALTYAETVGMIPRSGAIARFPQLTHGGYVGLLMGWAYLLAVAAVPPIEAEAVVTYASSYMKGLVAVQQGVTVLAWPVGIILAFVLMVVFFLINLFGVQFLGRFNVPVSIWKIVVPTLTFLLIFTLSFHAANFVAYGGFAPLGVKPIFVAVAIGGIVFAYGGFRKAFDFAGEARNPQRDVPLASLLAVATLIALYVLLQIAFTGAIEWSKAGIKLGDWAGLTSGSFAGAPFYDVLKASGVGFLGAFGTVLLIDAFISPAGSGYVFLGSATRSLYGLSVNGYVSRGGQALSRRFRIPWIALVASTVLGMMFLAPVPSWYLLVGFVTAATVVTYIWGGLGVQILRRTAGDLHRPFRLWRAGVMGPIAFLAAVIILYWTTFAVLINVVAAVFVVLPALAWFYGPRQGWLEKRAGALLGGAFLVAWIGTKYFGGWVLTAVGTPLGAHPTFLLYYALELCEVVGFTAAMWALSNREGRQAVAAAWWFIFLVFASLLLSYYGGYGPLASPLVPFPWDSVAVLPIGLVAYYWGLASGYTTAEIKAITDSGAAVVAGEGDAAV